MQRVFHQYRDKTLDDYEVCDDSQQEAVDTVRAYINDLETMRTTGHGLTFIGPSGVGKGFLASQVLLATQEKNYRIEALEMAGYVDLMKQRFQQYQMVKAVDSEEAIDNFARTDHHLRFIQGTIKKCADWLLLDDIGREFPSDSGWSQMQLFDTLRFRYNRGLPFLLTSNLGLAELTSRYEEGLTSLLKEATTIVGISGQDYRARGQLWSVAN